MTFFPSPKMFSKVLQEVEGIEKLNPSYTRTQIVMALSKVDIGNGKFRSIRTCQDYVKWVYQSRSEKKTDDWVIPKKDDDVVQVPRKELDALYKKVDDLQNSDRVKTALFNKLVDRVVALETFRNDMLDIKAAPQSKRSVVQTKTGDVWVDSNAEKWWLEFFTKMNEPCERFDRPLSTGAYGVVRPDFYLPRLGIYFEAKDPSQPGQVEANKRKFQEAAQATGETILFTDGSPSDLREGHKIKMYLITPNSFKGKLEGCTLVNCPICYRLFISFHKADRSSCGLAGCAPLPPGAPIPMTVQVLAANMAAAIDRERAGSAFVPRAFSR